MARTMSLYQISGDIIKSMLGPFIALLPSLVNMQGVILQLLLDSFP
jgi:hypothetical protein